ncbi:ankyrin protein [Fusarium globosum]|uniref:Ankyrin protein n=1 Tax=Fusarium globosum TaxID=78864 RepID=A0A8H5YWT2_9HYPO|nr:ankyrin protein [Fusarium globosum]
MSNPHDYIVGWICALHIEYVAAKTFLDEKHEPPEFVSTNDNNLYTLGKIGKHNTVIAVLLHGEYGIAPAASVARDMLHSFPNIRIGLMVGIGGGAPSPKHDIRLGDIVVSASDNVKHGGVFNFDHGKVVQGQPFKESGFLNQPPMILRTAVQGLRSEYEAEGHQLERDINKILDHKGRLRKKYGRPQAITDRLHQPWVLHQPHDDPNCDHCSNDPSSLIIRAERTSDEDNPTIHYGLIASSNKLMKDATIRDELAKKGVLCFETEAAGLMNHFPCLVIRGICDYADTHKNDQWQGYAAMTAAAYAKDLLCQIHPNRAVAEAKISENELSATTRKVNTIMHHNQSRENKDILQWLTPSNYSLLQSDNIARRQPGTGQWFINSPEFCHWRDSPAQTLFCPGIPGAGKTILTSIVIDSLEALFSSDKTVGIAYVYCNFQRQNDQTAKELLASLLKQLLQSLPAMPDSVKPLYEQHRTKGSPPSLEDVSSNLLSTAKLFSRVFIIIDALDECRATDGTRTKFLEEIFKLQLHFKANLFATSRPIPEVKDQFQTSITLEVRATDEDVERFLRGHMPQMPGFFRREGLEELVIGEIIRSVEGMFLLAQLHLDSLLDKISVDAVHKALAKLPSGSDAYFEAYETAMERVMSQSPSHRDLAKRVIAWITCALRPLTVEELRHALAVEVGKAELNKDALPETNIILQVCVGLVTVGEGDGIIRLVHYTTQEYFEKTKITWFPEAENEITTTCVTYLSFQEFKGGICPTDQDLRKRLDENPLFHYASHHWGNHARNATSICKGVIEFLKSDSNVESSAQSLMARRRYSGSQRVPENIKGLHLAAYFGNVAETQILLLETDPDLKDGDCRTALSYAAGNGHSAVVKLLLKKGANIDRRDSFLETALSRASVGGHVTTVRILLENHAQVDPVDYFNQTPLSLAAEMGHAAIVQLLLENRAEVDSMTEDGQTPLLMAATNGHKNIVQLLLNNGADVYWTDNYMETALSLAVYRGHTAVVQLLLDSDAEVDSETIYGETPFKLATKQRNGTIVQLLLDYGADANRPSSTLPIDLSGTLISRYPF